MGHAHTWIVFGRVRIVAFVAASLLDLALAVIGLVTLLSGWNIYNTMHRVLSLMVFLINLLSTLGLVLLSITRIRPMVDLGCIFPLFLVQIGSIATYTLTAPLPCPSKGIITSCAGYMSFILYGSCVSCAILCLYLLILFPMLRIPRPQKAPSYPFAHTKEKSLTTFSETASSLTYHSWDHEPKKASISDTASFSTYQSWDQKPSDIKKHQSTMSRYSQASFGNQYSYSLEGVQSLPYNQKPLTVIKKTSPKAPPHPLSRVTTPSTQQSDLPPGALDDNAYLRPYSPPPVDQTPVPTSAVRSSVISISSQDTSYAASWLMAPPRAVLPSPKQSKPLSIPEPSKRVKTSPSTSGKAPRPVRAKMVSVRKHRPGMLSLDTFQDSDSVTLSDVPRSPSPIEPYSPHSPFPPTPRSGMLPKHPRLTMHLRDVARGQTPFSSPRI